MLNVTEGPRTALPDPTSEPVVSVERAGQILGISRASAYAAVHEGTIPSIRLGRRLVIPSAEILRMLGIEVNRP